MNGYPIYYQHSYNIHNKIFSNICSNSIRILINKNEEIRNHIVNFHLSEKSSEIPNYVKHLIKAFNLYFDRTILDFNKVVMLEERILFSEYLTEEDKKQIYSILNDIKKYAFNICGSHKLIPQIVLSKDYRRFFMFPYHAKKTQYLYSILENIISFKPDNTYDFYSFDINGAVPRFLIYTINKELFEMSIDKDIYEFIFNVIINRLSVKVKFNRNQFKISLLSFIHDKFNVDKIYNYIKNNLLDKTDGLNETYLKEKLIKIIEGELFKSKIKIMDINESIYNEIINNTYFSINEFILKDIIIDFDIIPIYINFDGGLIASKPNNIDELKKKYKFINLEK